jgi:hypothetical protein
VSVLLVAALAVKGLTMLTAQAITNTNETILDNFFNFIIVPPLFFQREYQTNDVNGTALPYPGK